MRISTIHSGIAAVLSLWLAACVTEDLDAGEELVSTSAALASHVCPAGIPVTLAPAADQDLWFVLHAAGIQKYSCTATATGMVWAFVAPEADLMNRCCFVGLHYAGPTWEYHDGSTVVGTRLAGATVDATAIPWLLLGATSHGGNDGRMTRVTAIQRVNTVGGLAPASGCDATHVGAIADLPYTADYLFYRTKANHPERNVRCGAF